MFAEFFYKKRWARFIYAIVLAFIFACVGYAHSVYLMESIDMDMSFYFLVCQDVGIEASAERVKWNGGAGYFIEECGAQYVAITVFSKKDDAELVQKRLSLNGQPTILLQKRIQKLYFKGRRKEQAELYVTALNLFKSYILVLEECITRLENGLTQEACKRILKTLKKQLHWSAKVYEEYPSMRNLCEVSAKQVVEIASTTVYLKDLRYLLCWQAEKYIQLCDVFAL